MTATAGRRLESLSPSYFGLVMATGIVAIAGAMDGFDVAAHLLSLIAVLAFIALAALNAVRALRHFTAVRADFTDHLKAPGFFTWVAASAVVGAQFVLLSPRREVAWLMWGLAVALWIVLGPAVFAALMLRAEKPRLEKGINGTWLLAVVATQSIAVLSTLLAATAAQPWRVELNFLALAAWLAGGMLYTWIIALIFYRYLFLRLAAEDFSAPYWINMGAMAISTLAGALLVIHAKDAPLLERLVPFTAGVTILCWATATAWIPLLAVLVAWRYGVRHHPLRYEPAYWSAVFPLGMYSAATHQLALALQLPFLQPVATAFLAAAAVAWLAAFLGMVRAEARFSGARAPPAR